MGNKHSRSTRAEATDGEKESGVKKYSTLPTKLKQSLSVASNNSCKSVQLAPKYPTRDPNSKDLRLMTWNIQGLDDDLVIERAMAVCNEIESCVADIVYLQEIIPKTWDAITNRLQDRYFFYRDEAPHRYFHILMVRIDSAIEVEGDVQVMKFPNTTMARLLLHLPVSFHDQKLHLLTSHLESLNKNAAERKNQLSTVFSLMSSLAESEEKICIFGGDMNITGKEVEQIGLPDNFGDLWKMCGSDLTKRCTWDSTEPRMRLDRIYMCPNDSPLQPKMFDLVGESLLDDLGVYPSDHLGVWVEFILKDRSSSERIPQEAKLTEHAAEKATHEPEKSSACNSNQEASTKELTQSLQ